MRRTWLARKLPFSRVLPHLIHLIFSRIYNTNTLRSSAAPMTIDILLTSSFQIFAIKMYIYCPFEQSARCYTVHTTQSLPTKVYSTFHAGVHPQIGRLTPYPSLNTHVINIIALPPTKTTACLFRSTVNGIHDVLVRKIDISVCYRSPTARGTYTTSSLFDTPSLAVPP